LSERAPRGSKMRRRNVSIVERAFRQCGGDDAEQEALSGHSAYQMTESEPL
jgi:hypothetical protein